MSTYDVDPEEKRQLMCKLVTMLLSHPWTLVRRISFIYLGKYIYYIS